MKTFVIDTNVLLHDPEAMFAFGDNHVVIPMTVIEELDGFKESGLTALENRKPGPKRNYRRTEHAIQEVIRHRYLDPEASPEVIAQKLIQCGHRISSRSVQRIISDYGLEKKTVPPVQQRAAGKP